MRPLPDLTAAVLAEQSSAVRGMVADAIEALASWSIEQAEEVIARDDEVDRIAVRLQRLLEDGIVGLGDGPADGPDRDDVRDAFATILVNRHLERIGDYASTVGRLITLTYRNRRDELLLEGLAGVGEHLDVMVERAVDAFASGDLDAVPGIVAMDERVNETNRRIVPQLLDLGADASLREWGLRMIVVSRSLERIGDHAVDVAERLTYRITGEPKGFAHADDAYD